MNLPQSKKKKKKLLEKLKQNCSNISKQMNKDYQIFNEIWILLDFL